MGVVLRAERLTKRFERLTAVQDLDLEVREGEVFGFLGPNGAGKTTTLRLLCALIAPTSGTAEVAGYRLGSQDERIRPSVGVLTEEPGPSERPHRGDNLLFFAALFGLSPSVARGQTERYLRLMGLWDRRTEAVATFSRGMKQKMAIARAAIHEPRIIFLDEPTTGLDPDAARTVREFISQIRGAGRTVFLCTHNLDEPARLRAELYGHATEFRILPSPRPEHLVKVQGIEGVKDAHFENGSIIV